MLYCILQDNFGLKIAVGGRFLKIMAFQSVWTVSRLTYNFHSVSVSRLSGQFSDIFQTVETISKLSRKFPDFPDSFQTVQIVSRMSRQFPVPAVS